MPESRIAAVILSRGSTWAPRPFEPPYLMADPGNPWPDDATAKIVFYDTTGGQLATIDGLVTPNSIAFEGTPAVVDAIPAGANFEIFLTDADGRPYQIRYGKVIRREAEFLQAPPSTVVAEALKFTETLPTLGLRSAWVPVAGTTQVYDNSAQSLPNSIGPKEEWLQQAQSAIRWFQPLNGDSARIKVSMLNLDVGALASNKTTLILCADQNFTTYLGAQFEASNWQPNLNRIHFCIGSDPVTVTYQGSAISNTVVNGEDYTIDYNDVSHTLAVFKGNAATPLGSWTDSAGLVPHGPGFRYVGMSFVNGALTNGLRVTNWQAMDSV